MVRRMSGEFTSPDGENITVDDIYELCCMYDLDYQIMLAVRRGQMPAHKGWRGGHDQGVYSRKRIPPEKIAKIKELAKTCTKEQIAERFGVCTKTVENYINVY